MRYAALILALTACAPMERDHLVFSLGIYCTMDELDRLSVIVAEVASLAQPAYQAPAVIGGKLDLLFGTFEEAGWALPGPEGAASSDPPSEELNGTKIRLWQLTSEGRTALTEIVERGKGCPPPNRS